MESSFIDQSTVDSAGLCGNRSLSPGNDNRTAGDCRADDDLRWLNGDKSVKELLKNAVLGLVLVAACMITIIGNALVLHAVRTERKLQTVC